MKSLIRKLLITPWAPYVFPFVLFLLLTESARHFPEMSHLFYISKTILTGALLWFWRHKFTADLSQRLSFSGYFTGVLAGLLVLIIWVIPEAFLPQFGGQTGFNPYSFGWSKAATLALIGVRLFGAAVVVPVMEELFWRSFLLRYLINQDFLKVPVGAFSWFSFISTSILFGLEHNRIIVGIIAGLIYNLLLIRSKNLKTCILAHGITNLGLGIYVLWSSNWLFW